MGNQTFVFRMSNIKHCLVQKFEHMRTDCLNKVYDFKRFTFLGFPWLGISVGDTSIAIGPRRFIGNFIYK
jgi:hypothetical protein